MFCHNKFIKELKMFCCSDTRIKDGSIQVSECEDSNQIYENIDLSSVRDVTITVVSLQIKQIPNWWQSYQPFISFNYQDKNF